MCDSDDSPTDQEAFILERARRGDKEAWRYLYSSHVREAYRVALKILRDKDDTDDVVQMAFIKALEMLGAFDERSSFKTWLLRIVANEALSLRRTESRHRRLLAGRSDALQLNLRGVPSPLDEVVRRDLIERIVELVDLLPSTHRLVVVMRLSESKTFREISAETGFSISRVQELFVRSLRQIFRALTSEAGGVAGERSA